MGTLGANPASVAFGSVQVGANQAQTITLTNSGSSSVTISQASASGSGFSLSGISTPLTLGAGSSTTFTATLNPSAAGAVAGNVAITSTASNSSLNVALSGTGVTAATLAASPTSIGFGSVQVGNAQSQTERLTNSGGSPLHIATATVTGAGFSTSGLSVPTTLNAGQSLTFNVTFTPSGGGAANGNLTLTADGSVPNVNVGLSGTGTTPGQLSVSPCDGKLWQRDGRRNSKPGGVADREWSQCYRFVGEFEQFGIHAERIVIAGHARSRDKVLRSHGRSHRKRAVWLRQRLRLPATPLIHR